MSDKIKNLKDVIQTVHALRKGCPWDREQTHSSLRPYLIEEAFEVLDVLDDMSDVKAEPHRTQFREELGDLLLQILLHSELAEEKGAFDIYDVASELNAKLIRRHPHVFGEEKVKNAEEAYRNWEKLKSKEKKESVLEGLPKALPALQRSQRLIEKVSRVGFQWETLEGPLEKLEEELGEFKAEVRKAKKGEMQAELGDLLFCVSNVAHHLGLNAEDALRETLAKFESRFREMENQMKKEGKALQDSTLEEMDQYWERAKKVKRQREKR